MAPLRFSLHRYSRWDGSQRDPIDPADALGEMADDLLEYGDLRWALRNLMSRGMELPGGQRFEGLRSLLKQLRERKTQELQRYRLDSLFDDLKERLAAIEATERACIDDWLAGRIPEDKLGPPAEKPAVTAHDAGSRATPGPFSQNLFRGIAERNAAELDALPESFPARVRALEAYEFLSPDAQREFLKLLNELREAMASSFFKDIQSMMDQLSDADLDRMKEMVRALNEMLVKKIRGEDPGFEDFMARYGDLFGDNPPETLDELLEQMASRMAAAQALMDSLSPEQRAELAALMDDRLGDPELAGELRRLAKELDFLTPGEGFEFSGSESLGLQDALELMDELGRIDSAMGELRQAERGGDLSSIDRDQLKDLLGDSAADELDQLDEIKQALEDAGYLRQNDDGRAELTARGSRLIGQRALGEIYQRLKKQSLGSHAIPEEGRFGERVEQTKPYEYGDPFHLHLPRTLSNALRRRGAGPAADRGLPIQLAPADFEIYRSEQVTATATAMLVDLSWSMALRGSFLAAKKVALALHNLITSQYPKDNFYVIGFAAYARELKASELPFLQWDEYVLGTNMQHALLLADRLLAKHPQGSKQVIMISDGEPTAHLEGGEAQFAYPPTAATIRATFRAVKRLSTRGIAINTFMLEESAYLRAFMDEIARINGGRVFYTSPEQLGEYILVDYMNGKRQRMGRS